jgi:hypothetical protein
MLWGCVRKRNPIKAATKRDHVNESGRCERPIGMPKHLYILCFERIVDVFHFKPLSLRMSHKLE